MTKQLSKTTTDAGYSIDRREVRRAYARNGNAHNPTVTYSYTVLLRGKPHSAPLPKLGAAIRFAEECAAATLSSAMQAALDSIRNGNSAAAGIPLGTLRALRDRKLISFSYRVTFNGDRPGKGREVTTTVRLLAA